MAWFDFYADDNPDCDPGTCHAGIKISPYVAAAGAALVACGGDCEGGTLSQGDASQGDESQANATVITPFIYSSITARVEYARSIGSVYGSTEEGQYYEDFESDQFAGASPPYSKKDQASTDSAF